MCKCKLSVLINNFIKLFQHITDADVIKDDGPSIVEKRHSDGNALDEEIMVKMSNNVPAHENIRCNYYKLFKEMGVVSKQNIMFFFS